MTRYESSVPDSPCLVLAHGAGAGERHAWMIRVATGLAARGVDVVTFDFPYMQAGRRVPDPAPVLEEAFETVWRERVATETTPGRKFFAGGKSMGGRIATQVAARGGFTPAPCGVACFGYPLHPPGKPAQRRDRHLSRIDAPVLFLHGTRDPFGSPSEMESLVPALGQARLVIVENGDHSLAAPAREDRDNRSLERALDAAAGWMLAIVRGGTDMIAR